MKGMGGMQQLMKQANQMQNRMKKLQEELATREFEGTSGGGAVTVKVKWPNDILSEDSKVCGVLIENIIKQDKIKASIIGIGLNVNQTNFVNLPKASSLKLLLETSPLFFKINISLVEGSRWQCPSLCNIYLPSISQINL